MTDPDAETRAAVTALVHRLRNRGDADGQFSLDDEPFAQEFITALRSRGWRPVLVPPPEADWRRASGSRVPRGSLDPDVKAALVARMAEAAQATRSGTKTGGQPVLTDSNDPRACAAPPATETRE